MKKKMKKRGPHISPKTVAGNVPLVRLLTKVKSPKGRREILDAGERLRLGESVCSMCKNVMDKGIKGLTPKQRRTLRMLGSRRLSRKRRNGLIAQQKGGFLGLLLRAVGPLLGGLMGAGRE